MNQYRFIFQNGDVITRKTDLHIDDAIIREYVLRLNAKKTPKFCQIFSYDDREKAFLPVKKESVLISLKNCG